MKKSSSLPILLACLGFLVVESLPTGALGEDASSFAELRERFVSPPPGSGTVTLYWLNGKITKEGIREQMRAMRDQCGFSGVSPLAFYSMQPPTEPTYLSEEYFDVYGCILDTAKELGMTVVFYDDCDFPSGTAGNQMRREHPESLLKYLARGCATVAGPGEAVIPMPDGVLMSVVAKNLDNGKREAVTSQAVFSDPPPSSAGQSEGHGQPPKEQRKVVRWKAPAGKWEVQAFVCATVPGTELVDYLDPQAVRQFLSLTYDQLEKRFGKHFGTTIRMSFFDDLTAMHRRSRPGQ